MGTVAQSPLKMGDRVMEVIQDMTAGKSYQKVVEGAKGIRSKRSTNREACRWAMI
jgi:hypothetical protein